MDIGSVELMLGGVEDTNLRRVLVTIFQRLLRDIRMGRVVDGDPSQNFGGGFFQATTSSVAGVEFTVPHTIGRVPYLLWPVMPLDQVNAKLPRLTVTKAADANRVYLSSPDVSQTFFFYLEG